MSPRIVITRPEPANSAFADQVRAQFGVGQPILQAPLMRIVTCGDMPDPGRAAGLIFTSRNGVAAFAATSAVRNIRCYAVGEATARAAREAGLDAESAGGDADDLVEKILGDHVSGELLHVRGDHAAGDIAVRLRQAGIGVREVILYRQTARRATRGSRLGSGGEEAIVVPLFSPRSARLFFESGPVRAPVVVVAISRNTAEAVPSAGARMVMIAARPDARAIREALPGAVAAAKRLEGGNASK